MFLISQSLPVTEALGQRKDKLATAFLFFHIFTFFYRLYKNFSFRVSSHMMSPKEQGIHS
jgi:hypothetical protein